MENEWFVIIEGSMGPSIVGPFESADAAGEFAYNIEWRMDKDGSTKISTINPVPDWWKEVATEL